MKRKLLLSLLFFTSLGLTGCQKDTTDIKSSANDVSVVESEVTNTESNDKEDIEERNIEYFEHDGYMKEDVSSIIGDYIPAEEATYENPVPLGSWGEISALEIDCDKLEYPEDYDFMYKAAYVRIDKVLTYPEDKETIEEYFSKDYFYKNHPDYYEDTLNDSLYVVEYSVYVPSHFDYWAEKIELIPVGNYNNYDGFYKQANMEHYLANKNQSELGLINFENMETGKYIEYTGEVVKGIGFYNLKDYIQANEVELEFLAPMDGVRKVNSRETEYYYPGGYYDRELAENEFGTYFALK